jgi:hypothetical protein
MDYQQAQQERHYVDASSNALKYEPTGLKDIANVESLLETYKPIDFTPTNTARALHSGPVDEEDLRNYKIKLNDLYNQLKTMKTTELKRKENLLKVGKSRLLLAKERVQEKIDDTTELGNQIIAHKERLKEIQDEINALKTSVRR